MRSPFQIEPPALVSFSGGRTSAYMLRRILDEGIEKGVEIVFADTGKEREETYQFVRECEQQWSVKVNWVQREGYFERLIADKQMLPNSITRYCTTELKLKPIWALGRSLGWEHWTSVLGIRADEERRVAKIRGRAAMPFEDISLPLAATGVTLADVTAFWRAQPFQLDLHAWESNCDLCFLKGQGKRVRIMQDRPELAAWWIEQERRTNGFFRAPPRPSYSQLLRIAQMPRLFDPDEEDLSDCICGD